MCDKWSARGRQKSRIDSVYEFGGRPVLTELLLGTSLTLVARTLPLK